MLDSGGLYEDAALGVSGSQVAVADRAQDVVRFFDFPAAGAPTPIAYTPVGVRPVALAQLPSGAIAVVCEGGDEVDLLRPTGSDADGGSVYASCWNRELGDDFGGGDDRISGGAGDDRIKAGGGRDVVYAGRGADRVDATELLAKRDAVFCGPGVDRVVADPLDRLHGCEKVRRTR